MNGTAGVERAFNKRLSGKHKEEFLQVFREEFLQEKKNDLVKNEFDPKEWELLEALLQSQTAFKSKLQEQERFYLAPYVKDLQKKIEAVGATSLILYGFNELSRALCE
ncbi:MAG: hypothetical protein DSZ10_02505, partial [Sulfurovum sp.]